MILTLDSHAETEKFYTLLSNMQIDPSCVTYLTTYKDSTFFDFIAKVDDRFINFCHITKKNIARYQIILKFHEWIQENPSPNFNPSLVKMISLGSSDDMWFYEEMSYYDRLNSITFDECLQINDTINTFNNHIKQFSKTLPLNLKQEYNLIIQNYCAKDVSITDDDIIFEYGDIFTMFACNRITKTNDLFQMTGYQGLLFYDRQFTKLFIIIMSCLLDNLEDKKTKLSLINPQSTEMIRTIIQILLKKSNDEFKGFLNQDDNFKKHITELEIALCNE